MPVRHEDNKNRGNFFDYMIMKIIDVFRVITDIITRYHRYVINNQTLS